MNHWCILEENDYYVDLMICSGLKQSTNDNQLSHRIPKIKILWHLHQNKHLSTSFVCAKYFANHFVYNQSCYLVVIANIWDM